MENEGLTDEIKQGFILGLVSSNGPTHEMLNPHLIDQRTAFENQFEGMSAIEFSYDDYENFPSVKWKLLNLEKFKNDNPEIYEQQLNELESVLEQ